MKKFVLEVLRRGMVACGFGPLILVVLYLILKHSTGLENLTVDEVSVGIVSLSVLAFVAGGMNAVYQIERLPLMVAILIHGGVLYISYLGTYLVNGWLEWGRTPMLVFTGVFALGYLMIWAVIYAITKRNTDRVNTLLREKQQRAE
ncbi:MAG: DUF3021 domain-containing protein [Oscillospiraceae bacterium]|nr:DUF3021 domain-containing protein [Oscillospiraceae bacterium]